MDRDKVTLLKLRLLLEDLEQRAEKKDDAGVDERGYGPSVLSHGVYGRIVPLVRERDELQEALDDAAELVAMMTVTAADDRTLGGPGHGLKFPTMRDHQAISNLLDEERARRDVLQSALDDAAEQYAMFESELHAAIHPYHSDSVPKQDYIDVANLFDEERAKRVALEGQLAGLRVAVDALNEGLTSARAKRAADRAFYDLALGGWTAAYYHDVVQVKLVADRAFYGEGSPTRR